MLAAINPVTRLGQVGICFVAPIVHLSWSPFSRLDHCSAEYPQKTLVSIHVHQWNAYRSKRMVQMPMTPPRINESRLFLKLIRCIRLLMAGKRLARVLTLLCIDFSIPRWEVIFSLVAMAMLIVSSISRSEFLRCSCSFRKSSVRLLFTPDPLLYDLTREKSLN